MNYNFVIIYVFILAGRLFLVPQRRLENMAVAVKQ